MSIVQSDISVGKCFVTEAFQVRRVLEVSNGNVTYESRGRRAQAGRWGPKTTADIATFADAVEREVSCDYDPNFSD